MNIRRFSEEKFLIFKRRNKRTDILVGIEINYLV